MNTAPATMAQSPPTTVAQVINMFWQVYAQNLNSGASDRIEVPLTLKDVIGDGGVAVFANRLRYDSIPLSSMWYNV